MAKEIQLTRGQVAIVDDEDFDRVMAHKWHAGVKHQTKAPDEYYAYRSPDNILMHRFIMDAPKDIGIDHRDGDSLNNRRQNLRPATQSQNGCNRGKQKNNTTGYKGVGRSFNNKVKPFRADIKLNGKHFYLGVYGTAAEAAEAYNQAALRLHGEFAMLNAINK